MRYSVLLVTHYKNGIAKLPHYRLLERSNPSSDIHVICIPDTGMPREFYWKNSDVFLIDWVKKNRRKIINDQIAIIEWDTVVNDRLPELPNHLDLVGARHFLEPTHLRGQWQPKRECEPEWTKDNWMWWPEIQKLDMQEGEQAHGLVSFGALFIKKNILLKMCDQQYDTFFERDIVSELRFPTIAARCGARVGEIHLPFVKWHEVDWNGEDQGIFHSVKQYNARP